MALRKFTELIAWQKAIDLVESVYRVSGTFPKCELYGLTSQVRRAAVSIPANIAEGQSRSSSREFVRFLSIAEGSLAEVETHLVIAKRLDYISAEHLDGLLDQAAGVARLVKALTKAIERKIAQAH